MLRELLGAPLREGAMEVDQLSKAKGIDPAIEAPEETIGRKPRMSTGMDIEKQLDGFWVSTRAREGKISAIKEMAMLSAKVADAASLAWGLPSFRTPEPIRRHC